MELFNRLYSKAFLYADCNFRYVEKATVNGRIEREQTNMTVLASYKVDRSEVEQKDEEVIYGGVIFPTARRFGHMLIETMSRLWYVVEGNSPELKIAFVILPESREFADTSSDFLGIDMSRYG